jgi:hypothetical protein
LPGDEFVGWGKILGYDLACDQCRGAFHLEFDDDGWRKRLVAAATQSGTGYLDISNDLK